MTSAASTQSDMPAMFRSGLPGTFLRCSVSRTRDVVMSFGTEHADRATAREPGGDGASAEGARGRSPRPECRSEEETGKATFVPSSR